MTLCKALTEKTKDGKTVTAWEKYEKFSPVPKYEITVSVDGIALEVIKTSKTTWKKRFNEI